MNRIFSVFMVVVLFTTLSFSQTAAVDLIINVADNAGGSRFLHYGLDLTATTGIDPHLGEIELTILPPPGIFEAVWSLSPFGVGNIATPKDYRNAPSFPFTGQISHRLVWQYNAFATQISFSYNLPYEATLLITSNDATPIWSSGTLTGSGTYVVPDSNHQFSSARVFVNYDAILPVELTSFTSTVTGTTVNLKWSTASELNNKGFEVERIALKQTEWQNIGFVQGAGTSSSTNRYSFTDKPGTGKFQYRLRQIDFDGTFAYSQTVDAEITIPAEFILNQNYPNPFNPSTTIRYSIPESGFVNLKLYDVLGNELKSLVNTQQEAGQYEFVFDAAGLASGVYYYRIQSGEFTSTKKLVLMK